jgi:hypothetical protein
MIQEKEESPLSLQSNSLEGYIPGRATRNKSFQYHIPSNVNQNQPSNAPLKSVLKKTSVYDSVQSSSDKENFLPSPSDLKKPECIGTGEDKPTEHNTAKICAEAHSSSHFMMSVSTRRIVGNSSVATRSPMMPRVQFVTEPSDLDVVTDVPSKQNTNPSTRGKRTRFAAVKKRKLFTYNAPDTL